MYTDKGANRPKGTIINFWILVELTRYGSLLHIVFIFLFALLHWFMIRKEVANTSWGLPWKLQRQSTKRIRQVEPRSSSVQSCGSFVTTQQRTVWGGYILLIIGSGKCSGAYCLLALSQCFVFKYTLCSTNIESDRWQL